MNRIVRLILRLFLFGLIFYFNSSVFAAGSDEKSSLFFIVSTPVTDLRQHPVAAASDNLEHDPLQESQLLYGEKVKVPEHKGNWSRIEAVEQPEWTHHGKWEGYPGWVLSNSLVPLPASGWEPDAVVTVPVTEVREKPEPDAPILLRLFLGTRIVGAVRARPEQSRREPPLPTFWQTILLIDGRAGWIPKDQIVSFETLRQLSQAELRERIITAARSLIGTPYYWGGLSAGVDCSGLVYLAYRAAGMDLPRDAHEQWMKSKIIGVPVGAVRARPEQSRREPPLQPADLVFLSSEEDSNQISHVMLYSGNGSVIEGPGTGKFVHQISLDEKLSQNSHRKVYYATYFPKN